VNSRRKFLHNTLLGGIALSAADVIRGSREILEKSDKNSSPVVIATWGPNTKATAAAWEIISKGGRALDAVEAGARVPEADPEDTSVGYGGFPDRDGNVTLDACIMDELGRAGCVAFIQNIMHQSRRVPS
jgi:isoaspartyl peptidase/L-asparaginase-like protein (Ntn-hydrolase superfamily)